MWKDVLESSPGCVEGDGRGPFSQPRLRFPYTSARDSFNYGCVVFSNVVVLLNLTNINVNLEEGGIKRHSISHCTTCASKCILSERPF